jgi:hypothetical protein
MVMWLIMRNAFDDVIEEVYRFYTCRPPITRWGTSADFRLNRAYLS